MATDPIGAIVSGIKNDVRSIMKSARAPEKLIREADRAAETFATGARLMQLAAEGCDFPQLLKVTNLKPGVDALRAVAAAATTRPYPDDEPAGEMDSFLRGAQDELSQQIGQIMKESCGCRTLR